MNNSLVAIILSNDGKNRFVRNVKEDGFRFDGEDFQCREIASNWIGFYDWLRTDASEIIGLRLTIDDPDIFTPMTYQLLQNASHAKAGSVIYLFFGQELKFCASLSDDSDFGGNFICEGSRGSVGITFNEPSMR